MEVHFDYKSYNVENAVVTTGVFDGVHKGHLEILERLKKAASAIHGSPVVITFWPHPRLVLHLDPAIKLLNTLDEKLELLEKAGIEHVVVIPFTEEFSQLSSDDFITKILVEKLNVRHLIVGFNHHFGKGREGDFDQMLTYGERFGFSVEKLEAQIVENEKVSSTLIRKALVSGEVDVASRYLGYDYSITGTVIVGNRIGRTIGFPTANLRINHDFKLIPKEGVYAVNVDVCGIRYAGMLNMGYRPTINANPAPMSIEVHLINFEGDLYEKDITLHFKQRIRDEVKFNGIEALKQQLNADKAAVMKILES
ncbi:MAG: bifunctional riboflavin kinase/FAD synthetase [Bacteroidota bacterium]|nr:bifunctional riboflavin kinase/FAD synthetase [Bacteroidota bacterium]